MITVATAGPGPNSKADIKKLSPSAQKVVQVRPGAQGEEPRKGIR
jgi:hypothetical protein